MCLLRAIIPSEGVAFSRSYIEAEASYRYSKVDTQEIKGGGLTIKEDCYQSRDMPNLGSTAGTLQQSICFF